MKPITLTDREREALKRDRRAKIWTGVWKANGISMPAINALLRARIDSNRRLLQLSRQALNEIEGVGDIRLKEIEAYRKQFEEEAQQ